MLDIEKAKAFIESSWEQSIIPTLHDYILIPNQSPAYDPEWEQHGYMDQAVQLMVQWAKAQQIAGCTIEVVKLKNRTPVIYIEVASESDKTVLLYGHLDKQPAMEGWSEGLGPWTPVRRGDKLYGRGGADDGYALFAILTAIKTLQMQNIPHGRCVAIIEASEESGSTDLPFYMQTLKARLGQPNFIICLDSSAGNYEQMWGTTSLRGLVGGTLTVELLKEGVHSGAASGAIASTFRIARQLLSRVEDEKTGEILIPELHVDIPPDRVVQMQQIERDHAIDIAHAFPLLSGARLCFDSLFKNLLYCTWKPTLSITGADGLPAVQQAGSVLRPRTALKLSFRIPPTCDPKQAAAAVKKILERDPPYGAHVTFTTDGTASGWNAPVLSAWVARESDAASQAFFGKPTLYRGEGGTIPFMAMLGELFPDAQFLITGVLGPQSNAHGPNEFLHLTFAKKITGCVAWMLAQQVKE